MKVSKFIAIFLITFALLAGSFYGFAWYKQVQVKAECERLNKLVADSEIPNLIKKIQSKSLDKRTEQKGSQKEINLLLENLRSETKKLNEYPVNNSFLESLFHSSNNENLVALTMLGDTDRDFGDLIEYWNNSYHSLRYHVYCREGGKGLSDLEKEINKNV